MATAPFDVLCCVFELLPFVDRVCTTHVCRKWRMASLSSPGTLWSRIVSNGRRDGVLGQLLDRSRRAPVDVEVLLRAHTFEDAMASISKNLFHIRRLHLHAEAFGEDEPVMRNMPRIYDALAVPAPLLEHLDIGIAIEDPDLDDGEMEDLPDFDYRIPLNLFAGYAPCLRRVAWLSMVLHPDGVPAFSAVTHFSFKGRVLSASHLAAIVGLPRLTSLRIELNYSYELPATSSPTALCLDELELDVDNLHYDQTPVALLQYLNYNRARLVTVERFSEWLEMVVAPPRGLPHALHIYDRWASASSWRMQPAGRDIAQGYVLFADGLLPTPLAHEIFAALETFIVLIPFIVGPRNAAMPQLPQLARLVLCFRGREDMDRACVSCLTPPIQVARLVCPNLRTLEIRDAGELADSAYTPTLSVDDIELLVENMFIPAPDARPHVTLRHIDVPFPRPERFWGRPIEDGLTITHEYTAMPLRWKGSDWNIKLYD